MKKVKVELYDQEILIFDGAEDLKKWLKKNPIMSQEEFLDKVECCAGLAGAVCSADGESGHWFIYMEDKDTSTISHEACHIAYMFTDVLGIQHDVDNHEAYAYLQGYIFRETCKALKIPYQF